MNPQFTTVNDFICNTSAINKKVANCGFNIYISDTLMKPMLDYSFLTLLMSHWNGSRPEEFSFGLCLVNTYNGVFVSGLISKSNSLLKIKKNNLILQIYLEYLISFYKHEIIVSLVILIVSIYLSIVGALASELILSGKLKGLQSSQGESNNKKYS